MYDYKHQHFFKNGALFDIKLANDINVKYKPQWTHYGGTPILSLSLSKCTQEVFSTRNLISNN